MIFSIITVIETFTASVFELSSANIHHILCPTFLLTALIPKVNSSERFAHFPKANFEFFPPERLRSAPLQKRPSSQQHRLGTSNEPLLLLLVSPDDAAEAPGPPQAGGVPPGSEQDDVPEPGGVLRPGATEPAAGRLVPQQQGLHRLGGAGQRAALQEAHRGAALPAAAVAR